MSLHSPNPVIVTAAESYRWSYIPRYTWGALFRSVHLHSSLHFNNLTWVTVPLQMSDQTQRCQSTPTLSMPTSRGQNVPVPVLYDLRSSSASPLPSFRADSCLPKAAHHSKFLCHKLEVKPAASRLTDGSSPLRTAVFHRGRIQNDQS